MAMKTVLGIFRAACYSPGMVERDEAILRAVAKRLETMGYGVSLIHEENLTTHTPKPDIVLHMARAPHTLDIIEAWEQAGCCVINSAESIRRVERAALVRMCLEQGIPTPKTWIVNTLKRDAQAVRTTRGTTEAITYPCWVKRAGACAQHPDDICRADDAEAYRQCLEHFHDRGITHAVVMEHIEGPCIKFYAVQGTDFFYWLPAEKLGYDKFAHTPHANKHEAPTSRIDIASSILPLRTLHTPLTVYGGDAIIAPDGTARVIDINDWPSFSACRDEAADAIAKLVMKIR